MLVRLLCGVLCCRVHCVVLVWFGVGVGLSFVCVAVGVVCVAFDVCCGVCVF